MVRIALLLTIAAAALVAVPAAGASTIDGHGIWRVSYDEISYVAAPGEANDVSDATSGDLVRVDDHGALITSAPTLDAINCRALIVTALCDGDGQPFTLSAWLGDGDDRIAVGPPLIYSTIDAGAGDDVIDARNGDSDRITCGDGDDAVQADAVDSTAADCESVTVG